MANNNNSQATENAAIEELQKKLAEAEAKAKAEAEAREAAEKKNAEAEAKLAELEGLKNNVAGVEVKSDKVKIRISVVKNGPKEDVQVFLNGRQYIIQRGAEVEVPRGVAEILANKEKMLEVIDAFDKQHAQ